VDSFATVGTVYADGISLIFDGTGVESEKHYRCNTSVFFRAGDRVKLERDSGTYIVAYAVGAPQQTRLVGIPSGGAPGRVLAKASATDYDVMWGEMSAEKLSIGPSYSNYQLAFDSSGNLVPTYASNRKIKMGTSSAPLGGIYSEGVTTYGDTNIGATKSGTTAKLGFFGKSAIGKQTLSSSATLSQLITALKNYGLFG